MRYISLLNDIKSWTEYLLPDIHITLDIKKGKLFQVIIILSITNCQ